MIKVSVKLWYEDGLVREPILAQLVDRFHVVPNIRRANVEHDLGWILCDLEGDESAVDEATEWLRGVGVDVEVMASDEGSTDVR